ncbi:hypothetical protein MBT84_40700 [Streptomyces sp. MBT84]|nr:hypothetical protein [Streptomyces sp. MBT84]
MPSGSTSVRAAAGGGEIPSAVLPTTKWSVPGHVARQARRRPSARELPFRSRRLLTVHGRRALRKIPAAHLHVSLTSHHRESDGRRGRPDPSSRCSPPRRRDARVRYRRLDAYDEDGFTGLVTQVPYCHPAAMLDALDHRWPWGFGRFETTNPNPAIIRFTEQQADRCPGTSGRRSGEDRAAEDGGSRLGDVCGSEPASDYLHCRSATAGLRRQCEFALNDGQREPIRRGRGHRTRRSTRSRRGCCRHGRTPADNRCRRSW